MVTGALYCGLPWKYEDYSWLLMLSFTHSRDADRMVLAGLLMSLVD